MGLLTLSFGAQAARGCMRKSMSRRRRKTIGAVVGLRLSSETNGRMKNSLRKKDRVCPYHKAAGGVSEQCEINDEKAQQVGEDDSFFL